MTKLKNYRQGDVMIRQVASLPAKAKKEDVKDRIVLAYGEVTGHCHQLSPATADLYTESSRNFLEVCAGKTADVTHEEHGTITLPEGLYEVTIQKEYSPQAIRKVQD